MSHFLIESCYFLTKLKLEKKQNYFYIAKKLEYFWRRYFVFLGRQKIIILALRYLFLETFKIQNR